MALLYFLFIFSLFNSHRLLSASFSSFFLLLSISLREPLTSLLLQLLSPLAAANKHEVNYGSFLQAATLVSEQRCVE